MKEIREVFIYKAAIIFNDPTHAHSRRIESYIIPWYEPTFALALTECGVLKLHWRESHWVPRKQVREYVHIPGGTSLGNPSADFHWEDQPHPGQQINQSGSKQFEEQPRPKASEPKVKEKVSCREGNEQLPVEKLKLYDIVSVFN